MDKAEYMDKFIMEVKRKRNREQVQQCVSTEQIVIEDQMVRVFEQTLLNGRMRMYMPETVTDMPAEQIAEIFTDLQTRPKDVKTDFTKNVLFCFHVLDLEKAYSPVQIISGINGKCSNAVFYDQGKVRAEETEVEWIEYKQSVLKKDFYNILFCCETSQGMLLGHFYCPFRIYDKWKATVIFLLSTLKEN